MKKAQVVQLRSTCCTEAVKFGRRRDPECFPQPMSPDRRDVEMELEIEQDASAVLGHGMAASQ